MNHPWQNNFDTPENDYIMKLEISPESFREEIWK